jgi:hypothetical protein
MVRGPADSLPAAPTWTTFQPAKVAQYSAGINMRALVKEVAAFWAPQFRPEFHSSAG